MGLGVYTNEGIKRLVSEGIVGFQSEIDPKQIQPSSLDLRIGERVFYVPCSSLPPANQSMQEFLEGQRESYEMNKPKLIHKGQVCFFEINESLNLPSYIKGRANPKSSTGRVDVQVRLVTDKGAYFDRIKAGYSGKVWLEVCSNSFDVIVPPNFSFNQLRFYEDGIKKIDRDELLVLHREGKILRDGKTLEELSLERSGDGLDDGNVPLLINLSGDNLGYCAKHCREPVDLGSVKNPASWFFDKVQAKEGELDIPMGKFYILGSTEYLTVPKECCVELNPFEADAGEFRAHYAGFFDPAFEGIATLEVRNVGSTEFTLRDRQKVARFSLLPLKDKPTLLYGMEARSNYQGQRVAKLAKFFDTSA